MKTKTILTLLTIGTLMSCGDTKKETAKIRSFELSPIDGNDTINVFDVYGRKQGVWFTKDSKDTMVYLNDTGYSTKGTTARELIKALNERRGYKDCTIKSVTVNGTYHGKNLLFQNNEANGIQKILLDKKEVVSEFKATAFELPLTDLKHGQKFELTIVYCDATPRPFKILNEEVIK